MPLYLDRHDVPGATPEDVANAHAADLGVQDEFGVTYLTYWFEPESGAVFCLADDSVVWDEQLMRPAWAAGEGPLAAIVAHEWGHVVQFQTGFTGHWTALELQADCFAGVWARSTYDRGILDPGDIDEGLKAAAAVGDDRLGARSREQWTHGSSELRVQWFRTGFDSGKPGDCDTSNVDI